MRVDLRCAAGRLPIGSLQGSPWQPVITSYCKWTRHAQTLMPEAAFKLLRIAPVHAKKWMSWWSILSLLVSSMGSKNVFPGSFLNTRLDV